MAPASPLASTPTTSASPPCLYTCIRVIDGDTIEIADSCGVRTRVRLRSINAPELDQPGGPEAKAAVEMEMLGREVLVTPYARDRYGRLVAEVATPP